MPAASAGNEFARRVRRRRWTIIMPDRGCSHLNTIASVKLPKIRECIECVKIGGQWVHLRTCQECGVTLCCDSSPNRHATKHAYATSHPVIASAQTGRALAVLLSGRRFLPVLIGQVGDSLLRVSVRGKRASLNQCLLRLVTNEVCTTEIRQQLTWIQPLFGFFTACMSQ
jgi:hypothetical protein